MIALKAMRLLGNPDGGCSRNTAMHSDNVRVSGQDPFQTLGQTHEPGRDR